MQTAHILSLTTLELIQVGQSRRLIWKDSYRGNGERESTNTVRNTKNNSGFLLCINFKHMCNRWVGQDHLILYYFPVLLKYYYLFCDLVSIINYSVLSVFCELKWIPRELWSLSSAAQCGFFRPAESLLQICYVLEWVFGRSILQIRIKIIIKKTIDRDGF